MKLEERELLSPRGGRTGCFRWFLGDWPLCDHEHDEGQSFCDGAREELSTQRARAHSCRE